METAFGRYYGFSAISRSFRHFAAGKSFKLISSLTILILLARSLEQSEYAAYISVQALISLIGLLASFGIGPVLFRYLPELRATGNNLSLYRFLLIGVLLRFAVIAGLMLIILPFLGKIAALFHLTHWLWLLPWFLAVGLLHLIALFISQSLESLLWQKEAQYTLATGSMAKLLAIITVVGLGHLNLVTLLFIEAVTETLILLLLIYRWRGRWSSDERRTEGNTATWWNDNHRRVYRFGLISFFVNQSRILYGSAPNRLLTAHLLSSAEVAVLGVADSILKLARRFMPTRMLIGLIRPVFMARYSSNGDFQQLVRMSNLVYRLNMLILILPITLLLVVGHPALDWLTANKYGSAGPLLGGFLILMITESMRGLLELLVQAVEKNEIVLVSNLLQSASLLLAIPLFPQFGLWALVIANMTGTVVANVLVVVWLRTYKHVFKLDVRLALLIVVYGSIAAVSGLWVMHQYDAPMISALVITAIYGLLCAVHLPLHKYEKNQLFRLLRDSLKRKVPT